MLLLVTAACEVWRVQILAEAAAETGEVDPGSLLCLPPPFSPSSEEQRNGGGRSTTPRRRWVAAVDVSTPKGGGRGSQGSESDDGDGRKDRRVLLVSDGESPVVSKVEDFFAKTI